MSGNISFNYIPPNLRVPLFFAEFNNTAAGVSQPVQRTLVIGQTITAQPETPSFVVSPGWAVGEYGNGSQLAAMIAAYRANDPIGELWALPLADATGSTAATLTVTFSGTATAAGTHFLYIAGTLVTVGVSSGDTATVQATNAAAAVNAMSPALPVSATSALGVLTLTARNKGTLGNQIQAVVNYLGSQGGQATPAGVTVTITAASGGATDPSLSGVAAALGVQAFDFIVSPYSDTTSLGETTAMMSDASGRWSYAQSLYGHVFSAHGDTAANLLTYGAGLNDQHLSVLAVNPASPSPPFLWAPAAVGAGAPAVKNQPNRPFSGLQIAGVLPPPAASDWSFSTQQSFLTTGLALAVRGPGGVAQWVRCVTTYQLNSFGVADQSYLDVGIPYTLMAVVRALKAAVTQKFPRALIADDGTRIGPPPPGDTPVMVTPLIIKGELVAQYGALVDAMLVDNEATFAQGLIVQRNATDPTRVDVLYDPSLVSGLYIFATLMQFRLLPQQQQNA
ncbi:MAG: phage tail protein [Rhodospirillales bacterium]|nr:phage tail protein [Rhodospirillales bacterium]